MERDSASTLFRSPGPAVATAARMAVTLVEGLLLELRIALYRAQQLVDHVQPFLHGNPDLAERGLGRVLQAHEPVVNTD